MRVMLVAIGSTGDVAPYLGVAHELRQRGHEVCVATHGSSRSWVEEVGCAFALLPTEPRELMTEELQARLRRGGLSATRAVADAFAPSVAALAERIDALADDCEVMLTSVLAWTGLYSAHAVLPRPRDWRPGLEVVGYWTPPARHAWQPSAELVDFVAAGSAPAYIGFGSSSPASGTDLSRIVRQVTATTRLRAVVDPGWTDGVEIDSDDVLCVRGVDHRWLFPRMAAVVHHAGAGTTGAAVASGVQSVTVPLSHDQPFWARRLQRLGVAPAPVPGRRLAPEQLADALRHATADPSMRERAAALRDVVRRDRGAEAVAEAVEATTAHGR